MWGVQGFHEDLGGKAKIENIGNSGIRGNKKTNENKDLEKRNLRRKKKIGKTMSIFLFKSVENNGCRKNGHNWDCMEIFRFECVMYGKKEKLIKGDIMECWDVGKL